MNSLYGNYTTRTFLDIFSDVNIFKSEINDGVIPNELSDINLNTLYYLLCSRYGNNSICNSDEMMFKLKVKSIIYQYGPNWQRRLELQNTLRNMSESELMQGAKAIYNHAYNPSTAIDGEEIDTINDQNVTKQTRSKLEAYNLLNNLLDDTITTKFIDKFKNLFLLVVEPQVPLWYITNEEE